MRGKCVATRKSGLNDENHRNVKALHLFLLFRLGFMPDVNETIGFTAKPS